MTLRKIILLSRPATLLLDTAFLSFKIWSSLKQKDKIKDTTQQLPSINLLKTDGTILNTDSLKSLSDLLVLNYFNPDCDHCQSMVQVLFQVQSLLENVKWLMITSATVEKTKRFSDSLQLSQLENEMVLNDTASVFIKTFATVSVPSFYVNKNGVLLRKHSGECSIAYLVKE
jgi:thiol-disulfide isomerase/thioredoxin